MTDSKLEIGAVEWWYRSANIVERLGGTVLLNFELIPSGTPSLTVTKDYERIFTEIAEALDVTFMITTTAAKTAPESPIDGYVDHILFGKSGATLHLRIDANEGDKLDRAE